VCRKFLFLGASPVQVQILKARKHPLRPGRTPKICSFLVPQPRKRRKMTAGRGHAVHQGDAIPTVYTARTVQNAKVIGRRWFRWSTGAIGVRSHPRFRPDESRNATRTVPPRPPGPPQKGHFAAFSGGGEYQLLAFLGPGKKSGLAPSQGGATMDINY